MTTTPTIDDQLDTVTITGVPIFSAGCYPQGEFNENFLQAIADNYDPQFHEAPNYLSHEDSDGCRPAGSLALGWIKRLWVSGKTLFAEMTNVPRIFAELILAGRIKKRSVEIYSDLLDDGPYLRAVAWPLIPQVKGLADIRQLQIFKDKQGQFICLRHVQPCSEEITATIAGVESTNDTKTHVPKKEIDMDKPDSDRKADNTPVTRSELKLMLCQLEEQLTTNQQQSACAAEVRNFCEQMVLAGKMTPAERSTEQPLLIAQRQRELSANFSENGADKPLSQQRMDYYRNRPAFLSHLSSQLPKGDAPRHDSPAAVMFAEHRRFFDSVGVSLEDMLFAEKVEDQRINVLTYQGE